MMTERETFVFSVRMALAKGLSLVRGMRDVLLRTRNRDR
jgi:hypothetical protein